MNRLGFRRRHTGRHRNIQVYYTHSHIVLHCSIMQPMLLDALSMATLSKYTMIFIGNVQYWQCFYQIVLHLRITFNL